MKRWELLIVLLLSFLLYFGVEIAVTAKNPLHEFDYIQGLENRRMAFDYIATTGGENGDNTGR